MNHELTKHVVEVDAKFLKLTVDHGKANEELCLRLHIRGRLPKA